MQILARYTYRQTAVIVHLSRHTIARWVQADAGKPFAEQRFPGAGSGFVPLAAIKAYLHMTTDELRSLDVDLSPVPA